MFAELSTINTKWDGKICFQEAMRQEDITGGEEHIEGLMLCADDSPRMLNPELDGRVTGILEAPKSSCSELRTPQRAHQGQKRRRAERRQKLAQSKGMAKHKPKASSFKKHGKFASVGLQIVNAVDMPHSAGGSWVGRREAPLKDRPWTLNELLEMGYRYISYTPGNKAFTDAGNRMMIGMFDRPNGDWGDVSENASTCLQSGLEIGVREDTFQPEDYDHRRGLFLAVAAGVSFGGGQKRPGNMYYNIPARRRLSQSIISNKSIKRIAGFQSSALAFLAPKLYCHYVEHLDRLYDQNPRLQRNFDNSVFPAASFNCGPQTVSLDHYDYNNLSYGLCALTALGKFDYKLGGHLVLHDAKLVLEFPPGVTALIPSAGIRHGNTPIQPQEHRQSIAQYAAGGLFRWVSYGGKTAKKLAKTKSGRKALKKVDKGAEERWMEGLSLYSTPQSHSADHELAFQDDI